MLAIITTMTPKKVEQLANQLMDQHGLLRDGWGFRWSRGKQRLGCAHIGRARDRRTGKTREKKSILVSRHLVELNTDAVIRDVILHEIAHALAGLEHGHDHVWRQVCLRIGATPQRLAGEEVRVVQPRYAIVCDACRQQLGRRHRRVSAQRMRTSYYARCGPGSAGKLRLVDQSAADPR
jgi:predicted SprT family Zn-dependent metalloprotease